MNSKKNNKNSPVLDSTDPTLMPPIPAPGSTPIPVPTPKKGTSANTAENIGSTRDSDPTM